MAATNTANVKRRTSSRLAYEPHLRTGPSSAASPDSYNCLRPSASCSRARALRTAVSDSGIRSLEVASLPAQLPTTVLAFNGRYGIAWEWIFGNSSGFSSTVCNSWDDSGSGSGAGTGIERMADFASFIGFSESPF
jgi:hypothetical protein